jgi:DNA-binding CsgD family transcriptional regulator/tetratricopeptide (TPR) repeat protein
MMGTVGATMHLLERDEPSARLRAAVDEARSGAGRLMIVTGEAGVGKTALVENLGAGSDDVRVWTGSCEQLFTARPLGPLADIASKTGGRLAEVVGRGAPVHEVFPVLLEELRSHPTLVVIEDVHWADEATLDVIALLARRMAMTCSLVIVTSRDELALDHPLRLVLGGLAAAGVERLRLSPLSLHAVREMAAPLGFDADELFHRTGGNPFFVTEVLATGCIELPPSVRDAVLARAAGLDPDARTLLESVAIVTGTVPLGLVSALGGVHADRLDACLSSGMMVESGDGIAFRNELAREAISDGVEPLRRAALHATALQFLRNHGADAARLAHHAEATGDAEAVAEFAPIAAVEASARGSHREAAAQYRRAVRFSAHLSIERRAELLEQGAYEVYLIDQFDEAIAWLSDAVELRHQTGDISREGDSFRKLSTVQRCGGRRLAAHENGAKAVALLESQPAGPELAAAYANVAMLAMNASDIESGVAAAERALDLAGSSGDRNVHVYTLNTMGMLELLAGDDAGLAALEESLHIALAEGRDDHVGRAYIHLADIAQRHRRWDIIDRYYGPASEYCSDHGLDLWARYLHVYYARSELDRGRWDQAIAAIPASVDVPGTPLARIDALVVLGLARARRGDPEQWTALDEAGHLAERSGELQWLGPVTAARLEAAWLDGRDASVVPGSDSVLQACIDKGARWWAGEIAWWRRCLGIEEKAPQCAAEPWALLLAGRAGDAAAAWHRIGCPYEEAVALAHSDEPADLRGAFELFDSLGAHAAAALLIRRMRIAGVPRIPRGARATTRANPAGLTTRELDVLRLVARGLRNSEIADQLVVSAKTIDHHVSSVLTKLGVSSRGAAAREAIRLGVQDGEPAAQR